MTNQHSYWTIVYFSDRVVVVEECLQPFSVFGLQSPELHVKFVSFNEHKDPLHPTHTHTHKTYLLLYPGNFIQSSLYIRDYHKHTHTHNTNMVVE